MNENYSNENYNYDEYKEEKNRIPWARVLVSFLILVAIIIIILLLLKACGKSSLRDDLIDAAKDYYEKYPDMLPSEVGECFVLTLADLEKEGLIKVSDYETCDKEKTYVNVCYLESKTYHYSAILECEVEDTNYGMWQNGTENDIEENSDIRFKFLGEELQTGTKYYYPNDLTDITKVIEYYAAIPKSGYTGKEDEQIGYKWYTEEKVNKYWNNGGYSSTQPKGYPTKGSSTTVTKYSDTKPEAASYRKIEETKLYRYQVLGTEAHWCHAQGDENKTTLTYGECGGEYPVEFLTVYMCIGDPNDKGSVEQKVCEEFTDWSSKSCTSSATINCETKSSYKYTDTMWKWYTTATERNYYPSGTSNANDEITYYISSPINGAIKDESTRATVYKYYKLEEGTSSSNYEEWLPITDGYVTLSEMLEAFRELKYEVYSLSDINKIDKIRYQYQMQYRNLEE